MTGYVVVQTTRESTLLVIAVVHATVEAAQRDADRRHQYWPGDYTVCSLVPVTSRIGGAP